MTRYVSDLRKGVIVLAIEQPPIRNEFRKYAENDGFELKEEFHITIVDLATFGDFSKEDFLQFANRLKQITPPSYLFQDSVYYISKSKVVNNIEYPRESLIVPVISADIEANIAFAAKDLPKPKQFLHATLFTRQDNEAARIGIGIPSIEEWQALQPKLYFEDWKK